MLALTVAVGEALPTEFRIFKAGENTTAHGSFIFDEVAAANVMAAYREHGTDVMIDLEHLSVENPETSANFDPDARGWCRLELRNGELWAVGVTWTADGAARLNDKRQRYISPVLAFDAETRRVEELLNLAITALPATDNLEPLVAASARSRRVTARDMRKLTAGVAFGDICRAVQTALDERYPYAWIVDVYDGSVVYEFAAKLWEQTYALNGNVVELGATPVEVKRTYAPVAALPAPAAAARRQKLAATPGQEGDPIMTQEQFMALVEALGLGSDATVEDVIATISAMVSKLQDAANGTAPAADSGDAPPAAASGAPAMVAAARLVTASRVLSRLSGKSEIGEIVREVEAWHTSHVELDKQKAALAKERETLEASERKRLVGELVKLGAEIPATAWSDDSATTPAEPWLSMPIAQLRSRVEKLSAAKGATTVRASGGAGGALRPVPIARDTKGQVVVVDGESVELSASEIVACRDAKATLENYARNKLIRARARAARSS